MSIFMQATFWVSLHILCFSSNAIVVKIWSVSAGILQLIFFRSLVTLGIVLIPKRSRDQVVSSAKSDILGILLVRAISGFLGIYGVFYTITQLPVPIAMLLTGVTPIFVMFIEGIFLREKVKNEIYVYAVVVAIAIYFATNSCQRYGDVDSFKVVIGLLSGILVATSFVSVRYAVQRVGTSAVVFWFGIGKFIGPVLLGGSTLFDAHYDRYQIIYIALFCFLGAVSDISKTVAYKHASAWLISLMSLLSIPFSGILAWIFFSEQLNLIQWIAILSMTSAVGLAIFRRN